MQINKNRTSFFMKTGIGFINANVMKNSSFRKVVFYLKESSSAYRLRWSSTILIKPNLLCAKTGLLICILFINLSFSIISNKFAAYNSQSPLGDKSAVSPSITIS
jgi:hypothetical protein